MLKNKIISIKYAKYSAYAKYVGNRQIVQNKGDLCILQGTCTYELTTVLRLFLTHCRPKPKEVP